MSELKTLKDIKEVEPILTINGTIVERVVSTGYASKEELRQEAIKWIRHFIEIHNLPNSSETVSYQYGSTWIDYDNRIIFIKHFFNITEEDLYMKTQNY